LIQVYLSSHPEEVPSFPRKIHNLDGIRIQSANDFDLTEEIGYFL